MGRKAEEIREEMRKLEEKLDEGKIDKDIFKMRYRNLETELEETRGKSTRGGKEEEFIDLGDGITVRKFTGGMVIGGHYRVEKELGRGGMGVVYKAEDTEFEKERIVAVKILPEQLKQDKEGVEEFRREFVTATRLVHQNICCTYEFGQDPGLETYFIVMEYLEGETLRRKIKKKGKYMIEEAMWIIKGIAQGLGHAHKKGVLHLDMKPANVMLIGDEVKVMDFGLARKINASMNHVSMKKSAGTPLYMAPEQVDPSKAIKKVSVETDIWGLGVTVYEMFSGVVPFQGTTEYQLSQSILHAEPEKIDGLRDHEWKALKGTLEKEVEKRCKSCDEFWKGIEGTAERKEEEERKRRAEEGRKLQESSSKSQVPSSKFQAPEKSLQQKKEVSSDGRYWVSQSSVINDTKTGLQWYVGPDKDTNWDQAKAWAEGLSVDGGGWRMPTKEELCGIYEEDKNNGDKYIHLDPVFKTRGWWVWSGQLYTDSSYAWDVDLTGGVEIYDTRGTSSNTRGFAVRSGR